MSNDMKSVILGDVGRVLMCKRILKHQTTTDGAIPFFKISTFGGTADSFISENVFLNYASKYPYPKKGDILISAAGTVGKTVIFDGSPAYFQDSNIVWIDNDETQITNKYLYYYYQTNPWRKSKGSTITRIYNDDLRGIVVNFPDIKSQNRVTEVLSKLDEKIQNNIKINNELEKIARTVFDYWFIQFEFPDKSRKPYKSSGGEMAWSKDLKREIPEGWKVLGLASLIDESKNGDWGSESISEESTKCFCIRGADINGLNGIENFNPPVRYIDKSHTNRQLKADDLIIEISGGSPTQSTGRMAHISQDVLARLDNKVVCSNFCKAISLNKTKLSYIVSRYWARLYVSGTFFNHEGKTSGIKNLLFDQLAKDVKIALPTDENLINEYYELEKSIDKQKQNILVQNKELIKLRDWLLPMLMNGQVKVSDK